MQAIRYWREPVTLLLISTIILAQTGCDSSGKGAQESLETVRDWTSDRFDDASQVTTQSLTYAKDKATGAWTTVKAGTADAIEVISAQVDNATDATTNAASAAWVWSRDKSVDGWEWIKSSASKSSEWAADTSEQAWIITKRESGELYLWVKVESEAGVAWARTAIPAAWKTTKNAAGVVWVWVGEHKIEAAVAATVVTLIVAALIVEPLSTSTLILKSAAGKAATSFLVKVYNDNKEQLGNLTEEEFQEIGREAIQESGPQILMHRQLEKQQTSPAEKSE